MKRLWQKIKFIRAYLMVVRNPLRTEKIFEMGDVGRSSQRESAKRIMANILNDPNFISLWRERYNKLIEIDQLRKLPEGTVGRELAKFLDTNGFEPNGFPKIEPESELDYLAARMRQTHDLWHVLTGYDTTPEGELALQAFVYAQLNAPISMYILTAGLLHILFYNPLELPKVFERITEGYTRGKQAQNLATMKLESLWPENLASVRSRLMTSQTARSFSA